MTTVAKDEILKELSEINDDIAYEILDFIKSLKANKNVEKIETYFASEQVLAKDWLGKEEEEAWKNL
jgi:hypothetical protein